MQKKVTELTIATLLSCAMHCQHHSSIQQKMEEKEKRYSLSCKCQDQILGLSFSFHLWLLYGEILYP